MPKHTVSTAHIQELIKNAQVLSLHAHGIPAGVHIELPPEVFASGTAPVDHVLAKAVADLRHAADELDAERLSCFGWKQV